MEHILGYKFKLYGETILPRRFNDFNLMFQKYQNMYDERHFLNKKLEMYIIVVG